MKKYIAHKEYIRSGVELPNGKNTDQLYELERLMHSAINNICKWREANMNEKYWTEALPQTLLTILNGYDHYAAQVAAECYTSGETKEIETK